MKGIASLDQVCLISVKGIGMMRATGIAGRIFTDAPTFRTQLAELGVAV